MNPQGLAEFNGADLAALSDDELRLDYLPLLGLPGWLVAGWSVLLSGYPRCGKTELLIRLIREWLGEGRTVLLITEESRHTWAMRLRGLEGDWSGLQIVCGLGSSPELLLERACYGAEETVVVDTLRNLLQLQDERDNSEVARVVNPWTAGCRAAGKTLVTAHHQRKGGGEHGEGISGAHALLGSFDIAIEIKFDQLHPDRRLLESHPRLIDRRELVYEKRGLEFVVLGDPEQLRLAEVGERAFAELSHGWLTTKEVLETMGEPTPGTETVRKALITLAKEGRIRRDPDIADTRVKGRTVQWSLPLPGSPEPNLPRQNTVGSEVASVGSLRSGNLTSHETPLKGEVVVGGQVATQHSAAGGNGLLADTSAGHPRDDVSAQKLSWPPELTRHGGRPAWPL